MNPGTRLGSYEVVASIGAGGMGRPVFIARWVSWSPDSRHVYAAVADMDIDVVAFSGILG
jgi:hypothetical protein